MGRIAKRRTHTKLPRSCRGKAEYLSLEEKSRGGNMYKKRFGNPVHSREGSHWEIVDGRGSTNKARSEGWGRGCDNELNSWEFGYRSRGGDGMRNPEAGGP